MRTIPARQRKLIALCFKNYRARHGLSRSALARRLGLSAQRVVKIERETADLVATEWFVFCERVGISPDLLSLL
jgi:DNA-binding XRE family transcriptional regulator